MQEIKITRAEQRKEKPDSSKLVFGKYMTDHMFVVDYDEGQGWHDATSSPMPPSRSTQPPRSSITPRRSSRV